VIIVGLVYFIGSLEAEKNFLNHFSGELCAQVSYVPTCNSRVVVEFYNSLNCVIFFNIL
jgi:hypothetical protein